MRSRRAPWLVFSLAGALVVAARIIGGDELEAIWMLPFVAYGAVGAFVVSRRPENRIGWVFLAIWVFGALATLFVFESLEPVSGWAPLRGAVIFLSFAGWFGALGTAGTLALLLFPDGRLPGPRWKVVLWAAIVGIPVAAVAEYLVSELVAPPEPLASAARIAGGIALVVFLAAMLGSVASVVVRFRRSRGDERQQLKWFTYAAGLLAVGVAISVVAEMTVGTGEDSALGMAVDVLLVLTFTGIPVGAGIAILRYRLYDIDLVINKTLVYGSLAGFITAVYVGVVVGVGSLIGARGQPNLGLQVVATAVVAVAFQPVRSRVQRVANRLVYGRRSSPYETLASFSERVAETYAAEDVLSRMARIVADGTGAREASVWLRMEGELRPAARWPTKDGTGHALPLSGEGVPEVPGTDHTLPVRHRGELLGALAITKAPGDPLRSEEESLLSDLASQAGLVLRNARLTEDLRARLEQVSRLADELRRSRRRLVATQDAARRKLERDIHDGAQQHLVALAVQLKLAQGVARKDPARARPLLEGLLRATDEALANVRDLTRGVYPPRLEAEGLVAALGAEAARMPVPVTIDADGFRRAPPELETAVYFSVLEALQNAAKYAEADRVEIRLAHDHGHLAFEVRDDGRGFDPSATARGSGLQNMTDRLGALGGTLEVRSAPGEGTTVAGRIPVGEGEAVG